MVGAGAGTSVEFAELLSGVDVVSGVLGMMALQRFGRRACIAAALLVCAATALLPHYFGNVLSLSQGRYTVLWKSFNVKKNS